MATPLTHLTDFSDWLSPMLVKELRQGMRARGFTTLFLGIQLILALILIFSGAWFGKDYAGAAASTSIFTIFGIAVLGIQPTRGANALSSEITGNTLEMMSLTRLTAARIVFGKWIAIVGQSALLLTTIVPYLILRYFFGGMNLMGELVLLALMFLTSMALTAVMVGLSGNSNKAARALPIIVFFIIIQTVPTLLLRGGFSGGMSFFALANRESLIVISCYVGIITYLGWCALSHGISAIAPMAENHSTPRRLVALGLTCAVAAATFLPSFTIEATALFLAVILLPALLPALTEPAYMLPPICQPFLKRGFAGKIAALFLLPGWPTGVFFTCLLASISIAALFNSAVSSSRYSSIAYFPLNPDSLRIIILGVTCFGTLLLAALLSALFTKQENKRFRNFIFFVFITTVIAIGGTVLAGIQQEFKLLWWFVWDPLTILFMLVSREFPVENLAIVAGVVVGCILLLLTLVALFRHREYLRVFRETSATDTTNVPDLPIAAP